MIHFRSLAAQVVPLLVGALLAPAGALSQTASGLATFLDTVEVRVVNVDVVVLDSEGRPVIGLTRDDFELLENGKPVELTNFAAYEESAVASAGQATIESAAPAASAEEPIDSPRTAPPATWIVYVDQSQLQPGPRNQVARETRDFLASSLSPGDRSMVATFDGVSLKLLSQLSADRAPALDALTQLEKQVGFPSGMRGKSAQLMREIMSIDVTALTAPTDAERLLSEIEVASDELEVRKRYALGAFRDLLAIVAGVDGRVALLYAGGGFQSDPAEGLYKAWEAKFSGRGSEGIMAQRRRGTESVHARVDYSALLRTVNASRVTVYSIYAGDDRGPDVSAELAGDPATPGSVVSTASPEAGSTLAAFAAETGGRSFVGAPDLARRLETAKSDLATYYSLGYRPTSSEPGAFREVTVRVPRDGVQVIHRRGVAERAPDEIAGDSATAALLAAAPPENPFGATIELGQATKAKLGRGMLKPVTVRVPLRALTLLPEGAAHRAQLSFYFSLRDPDGGYRRLEPRPLEFSIPNENLVAALGQSISFKIDLALEPGAYQLGVAVVDRIGGASSATTAGIEVAKSR